MSIAVNSKEWLKDLKVGDRVLVTGNRSTTLETVTRLTKTQIVVGDRKFWIKDGWQVGVEAYWAYHLAEAAEERVKEIKQNTEKLRLVRALKDVDWDKLSLEQLREVSTLLSSFVKVESTTGVNQ